MDAGCGTAAVSRLILQYYPKTSLQIDAIDSSETMIKNLKKKLPDIKAKFPRANLKCKVCDLQTIDEPSDYYDLVICRFVYQHIPNIAKEVTKELFEVLRPGGRLIIIDANGVFYNLGLEDKFINQCLDKIKANFPYFDGYICNKIPKLLLKAGFKINSIKGMITNFSSKEDRKYEHQLWQMRFKQIRPQIEGLLDKGDFDKFQASYLKEIISPMCLLSYSKFVFFAQNHYEIFSKVLLLIEKQMGIYSPQF